MMDVEHTRPIVVSEGTMHGLEAIRMVVDLPYEDVYGYFNSICDDFNPAAQTSLGIRSYVEKLMKRGRIIAAVVNTLSRNGIVGVLAGYFNNPQQGFSFVSAFHVCIPFRRMHVGRMLMDKAVEISREANFKAIRLKVDKSNNGGIFFYERYGFVKIGDDKDQFIMNFSLPERLRQG